MSAEIESKDSYDEFLMFSRITCENWLRPDREGYVPFGFTEKHWADLFLQARLAASAPPEVTRLFEVARGCMICSWFFYPLATLGFEQCTRIAELAVWERCRLLQQESDNFADNLRRLVAAGLISSDDETRWQATRRLRNDRSHPKKFMLLDPVQAADALHVTAELINRLFPSVGSPQT